MDELVVRGFAVAILLAVASGVWLVVSRRRGTLRAARAGSQVLTTAELGDAVSRGDRLTIVQFSAPYCSPCRASERRWREFAGTQHGVAFSVVMAEEHLEVVSRLGMLSTPASAVFAADGRLRGVIRGVPSREQVHELREST